MANTYVIRIFKFSILFERNPCIF